ncbi:hypothetical protein, partial [Microbacterium maritypicum]
VDERFAVEPLTALTSGSTTTSALGAAFSAAACVPDVAADDFPADDFDTAALPAFEPAEVLA